MVVDRGRDADQDRLGGAQGRGVRGQHEPVGTRAVTGVEAQPTVVLGDEVDVVGADGVQPGGVHVEAYDRQTRLQQGESRGQPDIAQSDDADDGRRGKGQGNPP
jgi:hypothetical protein